MQKPCILDCDPGMDDALALALLLCAQEYSLLAVTTSAGNQTQEKTYRNARNLLHLMGRADIPVYRGANGPLQGALRTASHVHGESGLGRPGASLQDSPAPHAQLHAVEALANVIRQASQPLTIIMTGPATNMALLLRQHTEVAGNIGQIILMGGAMHGGNVSPCAEFNVAVDPEAAQIVFQSGIPITMFGLDVTRRAVLYDADLTKMKILGNKTGAFLGEMLQEKTDLSPIPLGESADFPQGMQVHDACTIAYLIQPELFSLTPASVVVETMGEYTRGCTVADYTGRFDGEMNVQAAYAVNRDAFRDLILQCIARLP